VNEQLAVLFPDELVERIARRAAEIVLEEIRPEPQVRYLTIPKAAERVSCSPGAMRKRVERQRVRSVRQGGRVYIDVFDLDSSFEQSDD
jgi:hypothetical protein